MSDSDLDEVRLDEPIVLSSAKVYAAIVDRDNIWKRPDSLVDNSIHCGASDYHCR